MYDVELENLFEDVDEFAAEGKGKYQFIEASCTLTGAVVKFERGVLEEYKIRTWATKTGPTDHENAPLHHLKILCFERHNPEDAEENEDLNEKLPCSRTAYEAIRRAWQLPEWTLRFLDNRYGNGLVVPYGALTKSRHLERFGVATKTAMSHWIFAFYDPDVKVTYVLICENERLDFTVDELLHRIERCKDAMCLPILAPLLLVERLATEIFDYQKTYRERKARVQRKESFYAFADYSGENVEEIEGNPKDDDLVGFTREFTKLISLSRNLQNFLQEGLLCMSWLQKMHQMFLDGLEKEQQNQVLASWHDLLERLSLVELQTQKNEQYILDDQGDIQASIQTIYALIGTNDSHLNYSSAQASVRIADDSRRVAILTRQDSTDMRVIAVATLLFLPATFVATLFSTDFFNFQPSTGFVSPWIWLYCVVTALLTVAVMLAWRLLSKARERETRQILRGSAGDESESQGVDDATNGVGLASGNALRDLKDNLRLSRRKKTPTMEMEEK